MGSANRNLLGLLELTSRQLADLLIQAERFLQKEESSSASTSPYPGKLAILMRWTNRPDHRGTSRMPPIEIRMSRHVISASRRLGIECMLLSPHDCEAESVEAVDDMLVSVLSQSLDKIALLCIRHFDSAVLGRIANASLVIKDNISIINAGGSTNENPLDALTLLHLIRIRAKRQDLNGLHVAVIGDVGFEAIGHSLLVGLVRLGANVTLIAHPELGTDDFLQSHAEFKITRADVLGCGHSDLPEVLISLPIREELFRTGIIKNRQAFLDSSQHLRHAVLHLKDTLFIGYERPNEYDAIDIFFGDLNSVGIEQIVNYSTVVDEIAVRMAAVHYCLET